MPERRVRFIVGDVELESVRNDGPTADALYAALPLDAEGSYWGGEIYFETPVDAELEPGAGDVVDPGAVAFWPAGNCLCIFWGPTPASAEDECRAASAVNVVGEVVNKDALEKLTGRRVRVEAI